MNASENSESYDGLALTTFEKKLNKNFSSISTKLSYGRNSVSLSAYIYATIPNLNLQSLDVTISDNLIFSLKHCIHWDLSTRNKNSDNKYSCTGCVEVLYFLLVIELKFMHRPESTSLLYQFVKSALLKFRMIF